MATTIKTSNHAFRTSTFALLIGIIAVVGLAVAACGLAGCASNEPQAEPAAQSADRSVETPTDDSNVSDALVIAKQGDQALFVDLQTQTPYVPTLPLGQIYNTEGEHIDAANLAVGNVVQVSGNGIMLESYPGQYPGIARVQVVEQGNPADADAYADVIAMWAGNGDEASLPYASVEYTDDLGQITLSLEAYEYEWRTADGQQLEKDGSLDADAADGTEVIADTVIDAAITTTTSATLSFSHTPTSITIEREPVSFNGQGKIVEGADTDSSNVAFTQTENNQFTLEIEPGYLYEIDAQFDSGEAEFAFHTLSK